MQQHVERIMSIAEDNEGFYDGRLEDVLPWSFWVQELADPHADVMRLVRVWHGDYIERYRFGEGAGERSGYLFRDGLRLGLLSISENMAFQYFRYFFNREEVRQEVRRLDPEETARGLPNAESIMGIDISGDDVPEFLSLARAVAIGYVAGDDYSEQVRELALRFRELVELGRS